LVYEFGFEGGNIGIRKETIHTAVRSNTSDEVIDDGRDERFAAQTGVQ
jgi:hypothetical protein